MAINGNIKRNKNMTNQKNELSINISHVWDVDGKPRGISHSMTLDGDDLVIQDVGLDEKGLRLSGEIRRINFLTAVHALLNLSDDELATAERRLIEIM